LIFLDNKTLLLNSALRLTKSDDHFGDIVVDQYVAMKSAERNVTHPAYSQCIYCQAFHKMYFRQHSIFRNSNLQQSVHVTFQGSPVVDAGGVFREMMSCMVDSVFSSQVSLLIPTPNQLSGVGLGRDLYVPNPDATTPLESQMFEFLGIVMGIAIRNKFPLPFRFPQYVYRRLLRSELLHSKDDIGQVDLTTHEFLDAIERCDTSDGVSDDETFQTHFEGQLQWTTTSVSGNTVAIQHREISSKVVTFARRHDYCDAVRRYRHDESKRAIHAIRRGITTVVPLVTMQLFTPSELEVLVCGAPNISVEYLKRHTKYENYRKTSRVVRNFWHVFRELSQKKRSLFIKFVWGRERLPRGNEAWKQPFTISRGSDVSMLPVAHTCFFKIDLPPYRTIDELRNKILLAIESANAAISMVIA